ncbi:MAG: ATP-binding protein, partial [Firmicutes bacterium]|nr:ATP-binding protein [Candidatus Scatoplasma merdavium]
MENKDNIIIVRDAQRLVGRNINERFDGDLYREIAELITNSLDSYSRINNFLGERIVRIELHKPQRKNKEKYTLRVIDNAEGMSLETLTRIFSVRGGDNNRGESFDRVRGMFGLGASDVMRISAYQEKSAEYYSFKNGMASGL